MMAARRKGYEPHVRMYSHEMKSAAWRTMDPDARALLVEVRSLYDGRNNRIHMSVREAMRRLGIGQGRAQKALATLLERGWIRVIEKGTFNRKTRHASVYALENEPIEERDGAVAPKSFMRWAAGKNTVAITTTDGIQGDYREPSRKPTEGPDGSRDEYRDRDSEESTVLKTTTQISYQRGVG